MIGLIELVERVEARIKARQGKCAVEFSDAQQQASWCEKPTLTFCGICRTEICEHHAVLCCADVYCPACHGVHMATFHRWLSGEMSSWSGMLR